MNFMLHDEDTFSFCPFLIIILITLIPYTVIDSSTGYMKITSGWIFIRHVSPG